MAAALLIEQFVFSYTSLTTVYEIGPGSSCRNGNDEPQILPNSSSETQALSDLGRYVSPGLVNCKEHALGLCSTKPSLN